MKVAHLDTGRTWRGGQGQVALLMRGLRERGVDCLLLAPRGPLLERMTQAGFRALRWESAGEWDVGALLEARRLLARERPEVVHCHTAHAHALGVPAARLAGARAVMVSRRVDFAVARNLLSALKYRMPVDRYLCISRGVMEVLVQGRVPAERLALVPSGVDPPDPAEARTTVDLRALMGVDSGSRIVGTVAALAPHKHHANLMSAVPRVVAECRDVHFAWIGEGECRAALLRQRQALGLEGRVHLLGYRDDARALMRQFTVFALASYLEGLCTSLIDAQMREVPVVATAVGGIPELIEHRATGLLVEPRDPLGLADALIESLADEPGRRARAVRARETVKAFSADAMVEGTLTQYRKVLGLDQA